MDTLQKDGDIPSSETETQPDNRSMRQKETQELIMTLAVLSFIETAD